MVAAVVVEVGLFLPLVVLLVAVVLVVEVVVEVHQIK